jgi:sulfur relay (sulfurtransferase) DsrC/TusE family protein
MSQDAKLWTIEDIDEYLKQSKENERNVAEYNASVDRETENVAQNTINQDVRDYYNNHTMSRSLAL